jgi:NitT/TauT family transport system substrate-binding protein
MAAALGIVAVACATRSPEAHPPEIRVGHGAPLDFSDLAGEIAHQHLEAQGYSIRLTIYASTEAAIDALARGDVDVAAGSTRSFWAAIAKGAPIRAVAEHAGNLYRLVAAGHPSGCQALDRRRLALHGEGAAGTALARAYLAARCPQARPEILMVPGSPNRLAAMLSGAVDAAVLKVSDVDQLERMAPGRFSEIADFAREWPGLVTTPVHVNTRFAAAHPDQVRDYVRARVLANRQAASDQAELLRQARRILGDAADWTPDARAHAAIPAWDPDGGLTRSAVARTLEFMTTHAGLDASLTRDRVADFTYLDAVLRELGQARSATKEGP